MTQPKPDSNRYIIYGGELSYFTRKLEAAMRFYNAEFELRAKSPDVAPEIEQRSGTHQVPVLHTPENWMIADTTPLIRLLDSRFPNRRLFPAGKLGVLVQIIEEYFDEWIARTMVHYRWHYEESARFASERMAGGNAEAAARVRAWGPRACRATGTDSEHQQRAAEDEYHRIMAAAEAQLAETRYLLGDRPTALDCIVLGGLRAHTLTDPTPKAQMQPYSRVIAWAESGADDWDGTGELPSFPETTRFASLVLEEMKTTYQPFVLGNQAALDAGAKAFHVETFGEDVSYLTRPYPEQSRAMIRREISALPEPDQQSIRDWLATLALLESFG